MDGSTVVTRPSPLTPLQQSAELKNCMMKTSNGTASNKNLIISNNTTTTTTTPQQATNLSRSNSPASYSSEIERELELHGSMHSGSLSSGADLCGKSNGSISGASSTSATGNNTQLENAINANGGSSSAGEADTTIPSTNGNVNGSAANTPNNTGTLGKKNRISSSRTPTRKARRIKFYRNGDKFYPGITIPVSNERYRSFESLFEDLTRLLQENVKIPGAVRTIYTMCGKKISNLEELEDGQSYICSCNNENFKKIDYNTSSQPLANLVLSNSTSNRLYNKNNRPASPLKNGTMESNARNLIAQKLSERDSVVHPRIVTLIRNGTKPRKIMRLLLNKRNSPSFDHVLTAITQVVKLDTGYVRKVFTLSGAAVTQLADFFGKDDVFFAYGTERVNNPDDFKLENDEQKAIQAIRKTLRTAGTTCQGPKPKMPVKSKNLNKVPYDPSSTNLEETTIPLGNNSSISTSDLPPSIRDRYVLNQIIGDGNFAVVLRVQDKQNYGWPYALKIIDKSKCKGKEHYIDAEVRVMKKLQHPHIISLIMDVDQEAYMYLVLEYVGGGDLFDAITRVTRFSEDQSRIMIKHLASAMAYLHSMSIVHRDIKPENLLVEMDEKGNVVELKLADFGLACEVTEPLFAVCGTPTYVAPEILMETGYGLKIDVWAAGIILYILLCGFPPFVAPDNDQEKLFDAIIAGVYEFPEPYWSDIGDGVRDLIANMLQNDPDIRFTSEDILDHFWTMNEFSSSSSGGVAVEYDS